MEQHRKIGCCSSFGEWQPDVNGIAIGFRPGGGLPAMAINVGAQSFNLARNFLLAEVRPRLISVVRRIEEALGQEVTAVGAGRRARSASSTRQAQSRAR